MKKMRTIAFLILLVSVQLIAKSQPVNDNIGGAIQLTVATTCNFQQYLYKGATNSGTTAPNGAAITMLGYGWCNINYGGADVWFKAIVPASGNLQFHVMPQTGNDSLGLSYYAKDAGGNWAHQSCIVISKSLPPLEYPFMEIYPWDNLAGKEVLFRVWMIGFLGTPEKAWNHDYISVCAFDPSIADRPVITPQAVGALSDVIKQIITDSPCDSVYDITYKGHANAVGTFSNGDALGFKNGLILTTGPVNITAGHGMSEFSNTVLGTAADPQLDAISANPGNSGDAASVTFKFIPADDSIYFRYVFGSEEYSDWVDKNRSDVFGFFLSGPNPAGGNYNSYNIALVNGGPVTIDSINFGHSLFEPTGPCHNCDSYIDNFLGKHPTSWDGYTVPLAAKAKVIPCKTYTMKFAIEDIGDKFYDSGLLFETRTVPPATIGNAKHYDESGQLTNIAVEGCHYYFVFTRPTTSDINLPYPITITIKGTATMGTDYTTIPVNIVIPAGQLTDTVKYDVILDALVENNDYLIVSLSGMCPCNPKTVYDTIFFIDNHPLNPVITPDTTICSTILIDLQVDINPLIPPSLIKYKWSSGQTTSSITVLPTQTITYSVTLTAPCRPDTVLSTTITIQPISISVSVTDALCGQCDGIIIITPLTGTSPYTYKWDANAGSQTTQTANKLCVGTYGVTVTDKNGCSVDTILNINTSNGPNLSSLSIPANCNGNSDGNINLTITGGTPVFIIIWSNGSTEEDLFNIKVGTYTVTVTDAMGCSAVHTVTVTEPLLLETTFAGTNLLCNGDANGKVDLNVTGGTPNYTYIWSNDSVSQDLSGLTGGTYSVTVTDSHNCRALNTINITEPTQLTLIISNTPISGSGACDGTATVTPTGGTTPYTYKWDTNPVQTTQTAVNLCTGNYCVTVTDKNGCPETICTFISNISITTSKTDILCYGQCTGSATVTVLQGTSPYQYKWSNGSNTQTINNLCAGNYTVTVTDANTSKATSTITITQLAKLEVNIPVVNKICIGQSATLIANVEDGTPAYTYQWNDLSTGQTLTVSPTVTTSYYVTVTDANGCTDMTSQTAQVYPPLIISAYVGDTTLCPGECTEIVVNVSGGKGIGYIIKLDDGSIIQSPHTVCPTATTTYTITADDNCTQPTVSTSVTINALPQPPVDFVADYMEGCVPLTVQFNEINPVIDDTDYQWDFGDPYGNNSSTEKNPKHIFNEPGTYTITCKVESEAGCKNSLTKIQMIKVYPNPVASFLAHPQVTTTLKPLIQFENTSSTLYYNLWQFGDGDTSNVTHPQHKYSESGTYKVKLYVETEHGCPDETEMEVIIQDVHTFYAPDAFTPDHDEMNNLFSPIGVGIDKNYWDLRIYDRWGELVFQTNIYDVDENGRVNYGWDGRIKGKDIGEIAEYPWICIYRDFTGKEHTRAGVVILLR